MHFRLPALGAAAALFLAACAQDSTAPSAAPRIAMDASASAPNRHIVWYTGSASGIAGAVAANGGKIDASYDQVGFAVVSGMSPAGASALAGAKGVSQVEADEVVSLDPDQMSAAEDAGSAVGATDAVQSIANPAGAFFFARQWHVRQIGANLAWAAGYLGDPGVKVAILDTGIDYTNLDLAGHVDLANSKSFVPSDDAIVAALFPGKLPFTDMHYHGTHVAATVSSNAVIGAGVTSRVTLLAVKVLGYTGSGTTAGVLQGIVYAADQNADVINMSLGSYFPKAHNGRFMAEIQKVTNYAFRHGTLIVVSAGNSAIDLDHDGNGYSAYCNSANVVCVSATGPTSQVSTNGPWTNPDALAYFSNFGRSAITVGAPGGNNSTAVWETCSQTSLQIPICRTGNFIVGLQGTSMASPHTAGVAALLVGKIGHNKPSQIRAALAKSADAIDGNGKSPAYGAGRVSAINAVTQY